MQPVIHDFVLIAEILGYSVGSVLSVLLAMLVRRAPHQSRGTGLLVFCALLWNVVGLLTVLLMLAGMNPRSMTVAMAHAVAMSGGAIFPVSFLLLWSKPLNPLSWEGRVNRWLYPIAVINAVWITGSQFLCPYFGNYRLSMYACSLNASLLLTAGVLTQVRGRMGAAADRIYLTLTLTGVWGSTCAIFLLERSGLPAGLPPLLVIAKDQSPFLAVLGALFFFARFRSSDVLIKHSLRVTAAAGIGVAASIFVLRTLPRFTFSAYPAVLRITLGAAVLGTLLVVFSILDQAIAQGIECWILRRPDYRLALRQLWEDLGHPDAEPELFETVDRRLSKVLDIAAVRILRRSEISGIESHAGSNAGQWWELACDDPCRRAVPGFDIDVLVPVRVHGNVTHVMAVAPGVHRRSLLTGDLKFLQNVAGQIGSRLEALAHERERIERQGRESNLRRLAAQAELKALRAQINPHFLFNSLNTVADLIVTDPEKAEAMTLLLAKVFRHVLMQSDRQLTRVSEEMDFLRTYLRIEEVRFGDRLRVRMELDPLVSRDNIPSLILQPLVENAIKHGLAPKIGVGNLSIVADCHGEFVRLAVEDDGMGPAPAAASARNGNGVGLKIIAERLRALYDDRATLCFEKAEHEGSRVTILIPRGEAMA